MVSTTGTVVEVFRTASVSHTDKIQAVLSGLETALRIVNENMLKAGIEEASRTSQLNSLVSVLDRSARSLEAALLASTGSSGDGATRTRSYWFSRG